LKPTGEDRIGQGRMVQFSQYWNKREKKRFKTRVVKTVGETGEAKRHVGKGGGMG